MSVEAMAKWSVVPSSLCQHVSEGGAISESPSRRAHSRPATTSGEAFKSAKGKKGNRPTKTDPKTDPKKQRDPKGKGGGKGKEDKKKKPKGEIHCRFFKKGKGTCRAGEKCEFLHQVT